MTWRISINHHTGYRYQRPVSSSYNEARITPISNERQLVMESEVHVMPTATVFRYWDWFGTLVHAFDLHTPHDSLVVTGSSVVETSPPAPPLADPLGWPGLAAEAVRDRFAEYLAPTLHVPLDEEMAAAAAELREVGEPLEACPAVVDWVRSNLRYEPGTTSVATGATDALRQGSGVCQDFTHLALGLLRSLGIPARYVSGYLHPNADAEVGAAVAGQSHAWVEAWVGDWVAFDPTNGSPVGERHVIVGRAREYDDLAPLHGIFHGGPADALGVAVELTRLS